MKFVGNLFIYFGLYTIFQFSGMSPTTAYSTGGMMTGVLVAAPLLALGMWIVSSAQKGEQDNVDKNAEGILSLLDEGQDVDFFLYLRPFDSTNAYRLSNEHLNLFSWELWERDGFDDIERLVARALLPTATLLALGRPGEHRGAGRVLTTEAQWQKEVQRLAHSARLIMILPSQRPGTLWELGLLVRERHLHKTIFIMPPSEHYAYVTTYREVVLDWQAAVDACLGLGLVLPGHQPQGALFRLDAHGNTLAEHVGLPAPDPQAWMQAIQQLVDADQNVGRSAQRASTT